MNLPATLVDSSVSRSVMTFLRDETPAQLIALAGSGRLPSYLESKVAYVERLRGEIEGTQHPTFNKKYDSNEAEAEALMLALPTEDELPEPTKAEEKEAARIFDLVMNKLESAVPA